MLELLGEGVWHTALAAAVVFSLLGLWRLEEPRQRLSFLLTALWLPAVLGPVLRLAAPERASEPLRAGGALLAAGRFADVVALPVTRLVWLGLAGLGLLLFLRDLLPFLLEGRGAGLAVVPADAALAARAAALAERMGLRAEPRVSVAETPSPFLACAGAFEPRILVSRGALHSLDEQELRASLAHELAHVRRRDPLWSWLLMGLRALLAFNPFAQLLARAAVREVERVADALAVSATGAPLALASALVKTYRRGGAARAWGPAWPVPGLDGALGLVERLRARALEARCRGLLSETPAPALAAPGLHLLATGAGLVALLFLVA